jgi:uncharacterized protein (TIGR03118 family)
MRNDMMPQNFLRPWALLVMTILYLALAPQQMHAAGGYIQRNLVSDVPLLADFTDPNLVNPWGIAISAASPFWLCDNRTGLSTLYTASATVPAGTVSTTVIAIPPPAGRTSPGGTCTGIVVGSAPAFAVTPGNPASFIFATQDGTISGWNRTADATHAIKMVDNSASGAVYDGLAIGTNSTGTFLYAANFHSGTIDVFDSNFAKATLAGSFTDPSVAAGFAPFNIQNLGGKLYVTYAKQDATKTIDVAGAGNGYVAIFDTNGNLLQHLVSNGPLDSPWGVAIAPASFGAFANDLLVGNFRDGTINAFDASSGAFLGLLSYPNGNPIVNLGIWGLQFGNGGSGGLADTLYFDAGISVLGSGIQSHGLFASITFSAAAAAPPPDVKDGATVNGASFTLASPNVAPGTIASIFGINLTDGTSCVPDTCFPSFDNETPKRLRTSMAGAQVTVNGSPVPIFNAQPGELTILIPNELSPGTTATVQVTVAGQSSVPRTITIDPFSPGLIAQNAQGSGQGAVVHDNAAVLVDAGHPAQPGEVVDIYGTGLGQVTPSLPSGAAPPLPPSPLTSTVATPTVTVDGLPAQVLFSTWSSCCVGLNQVKVVVPPNAHSANNIPVVLTIGGKTSNTVTIAVSGGSPTPPPTPVTVSSVTLNTGGATVIAGESYQGTVTLSAAASSNTAVALSSSNPSAASVPASVTVPAGSTSAIFVVSTSASVTATTAVTISASLGGVTQTATLTVAPAQMPPPYIPPY